MLENEKLLVEPAMSCCIAALTNGRVPIAPGQNIVVIVCGGNASLADAQRWRGDFGI